MANLNIDSPISRQIVLSFLDFLKSVEPTPSADLEGLEVVRECLEDVFKLNSSSIDDQIQPGLLIDYFRSLHTNKQPDSNLGCVATFPDAPTTSSSRDADESLSHIPRAQNADFSGEPNTSGVLKDELFGQFFAALDKIHFFSTTSDGEDDHGRLDRATNLFHKAVKELEGSGSQTIDSLSLSEMFKSQGNKAMQSKLYSDAVELYTYAIALCPNNSVYYCNRAAAFTQIHKYVEAISDCRKSIEIDPNYSKAYSRLGLAYYAQGNYRDAIDKGFTKALQLDPDNDSVKENIQVAQQKLRVQHRTEHQNQRSTNHSNQESANGEARGGSRTFTSTTFNPADLSSDITSMLMNLVGQNSQQRRNDDSETGRSDEEPETRIDEPEIRIGGNISMNFGDDIPEDLMGTLSSVMEMLSGAQQNQNQNQNPQDNTHRGPTPN